MKRISSSRTLRITYVGMKPQDVPIKPGTIKVMMKSDSEVLQEVVVTVAGRWKTICFWDVVKCASFSGIVYNLIH